MTLSRLISFPMHGALELAAGLTALFAAFALGSEPAGQVASFLLGALMVGLAVSTGDDSRGALPLSAHLAFERLLAMARW